MPEDIEGWIRTITCDWDYSNNTLTTTTTITGQLERFFTLVWVAGTNINSIDTVTPPTDSNGSALQTWQDDGTWKARDQMVSNTYNYTITFTDSNGVIHSVDPEIINNPNG
ncbi:MAG TPA: hypothetical protein VE078_10910 [Thermoanaerobaculia bacterium]|nr:hypothetical protein [Thermoanaerobaculia bacterium]